MDTCRINDGMNELELETRCLVLMLFSSTSASSCSEKDRELEQGLVLGSCLVREAIVGA